MLAFFNLQFYEPCIHTVHRAIIVRHWMFLTVNEHCWNDDCEELVLHQLNWCVYWKNRQSTVQWVRTLRIVPPWYTILDPLMLGCRMDFHYCRVTGKKKTRLGISKFSIFWKNIFIFLNLLLRLVTMIEQLELLQVNCLRIPHDLIGIFFQHHRVEVTRLLQCDIITGIQLFINFFALSQLFWTI